jgi:hypothetical protein
MTGCIGCCRKMMEFLVRAIPTVRLAIGSRRRVVSRSTSTLIGLNPSQRDSLIASKYISYIPLLKADRNGCFSAIVPRRGIHSDQFRQSLFPNEDIYFPSEKYTWSPYSTYVTGSPFDYFVINREGIAATFDGLTFGTRNVWEAKYGYKQTSPTYGGRQTRQDREFTEEKNRELSAATECGYALTWAFSENRPSQRYQQLWGGVPPVIHKPWLTF